MSDTHYSKSYVDSINWFKISTFIGCDYLLSLKWNGVICNNDLKFTLLKHFKLQFLDSRIPTILTREWQGHGRRACFLREFLMKSVFWIFWNVSIYKSTTICKPFARRQGFVLCHLNLWCERYEFSKFLWI